MRIFTTIYDKMLYMYCYMMTDILIRTNEIEEMMKELRKSDEEARNK